VRQHASPCRNDTSAHPAFHYIFASALRAAGRSLESSPSSCTRYSDAVNMLLMVPNGSFIGAACSILAAAMHSLEGKLRKRLRSVMSDWFAFIVVQNSMRCRHAACHVNAGHASPRLHNGVAQYGRHAHEHHRCPTKRVICARSRGAVRVFVLLCSCPTQTAAGGVEGKNYEYFLLHAIVDSTTY
jgi:hypothetical protein